MAGASEIFDLAADFGKASASVASTAFAVFKAEGEVFADDWRSNAEATSGAHGVHYPSSITSEAKLSFGIHIETGPESGMLQGRMGRGFEFGSRNQPPHLDGLRALPAAEKRLETAAGAAVERVLP
jgi:hypothetical protein